MTFDWSSSEAVALAKEGCTHCLGIGLRRGGRAEDVPCSCVLRHIFRTCYAKFRYCASREKHMGRVRLEPMTGKDGSYCWAMKDEEFMADFCLVSRRALDDLEYKIFRFHFLLGGNWKLCCRRLNMDRGSFFHQLYRIEQKLGRVYRELRPHALFPAGRILRRDSAKGNCRSLTRMCFKCPCQREEGPSEPPLRKVA